MMKKLSFFFFLYSILLANPPIYIAFHWHMHQPVYWPYESVIETDENQRYDYSVADIHNQRTGPYTSWPMDAIQKAIDAGFGHAGAQISFSGSLIENLNTLENAGNGNFSGWKNRWKAAESSNPISPDVHTAWNFLINSQTSCYWYWDGSQEGRWDSHPTRALI